MKKSKLIRIFLLIILILTFSACKKKDNDKNVDLENDDFNDKEIQHIDEDSIITWGVPELYRISDEALSEVNKRFDKLGYDFSLQIVQLDSLNYHDDIEEYEEENGPLDIVFTGFTPEENGQKILELIKTGYYMPLDKYLNTNQGEKLLELYNDKLWESVKVDNSIYTIPNGAAVDEAVVFAFNEAYMKEEDIKDFTGELSQLKEHIDKIPFSDDFSHIVYALHGMEFTELFNCDYRYGLLFNRDDNKAYNPYEYDDFKETIRWLYDYYDKHYINYEFGLVAGKQNQEDITKHLETGEFFVYIGIESELERINADLITYKLPVYVHKRLNGAGITANSDKQDEAFQLLLLSYTDEEIANLLVHGVDGVDYKLEDGKAFTIEGGPSDSFFNMLSLGIYEMTYPSEGEDFETSRLIDKKNYYEKELQATDYLSFNFYNEDYTPVINEVTSFIENNVDMWIIEDPEDDLNRVIEDIDKEFDRVNEELKEQGIDELVTLVNEALDEFYE